MHPYLLGYPLLSLFIPQKRLHFPPIPFCLLCKSHEPWLVCVAGLGPPPDSWERQLFSFEPLLLLLQVAQVRCLKD